MDIRIRIPSKRKACRFCGKTHTTNANHEYHEFKCKYNPKNLVEVPIFAENENKVKDTVALQYDFMKPVMVFVNKRDIRKVRNSELKKIVAYSLDSKYKPIQRYLVHQISKWRMPDYLKEDKLYPFKHAYAFTKEGVGPSDTFNWAPR